MNNSHLLLDLAIALAAALAGGLIARLCRLPVIVGYLVAGVVVGPHTPGPFANRASIDPIAEVGVALLMFAVGVHSSLADLKSFLRTAVLGGAIQIGGTILVGTLVGLALGWGLFAAILAGCALSLSSTAVMMKILEERGEQGANHGRVMLGILVVQDLALVLMMVLLPALGALFMRHDPTLSGTSASTARVHRGSDIARIRALGADAVIHAEFEASTEMIRQCLDRLGFLDPEVDLYLEQIRQKRYEEQ